MTKAIAKYNRFTASGKSVYVIGQKNKEMYFVFTDRVDAIKFLNNKGNNSQQEKLESNNWIFKCSFQKAFLVDDFLCKN